jgi:hypothetical protein
MMATLRFATMFLIEEDARPVLDALPPRGARCCDCDKDTLPLKTNGRPDFKAWDNYIASDEAWIEAGMARKRWAALKRWRSGFLCMSCLRRRLGRDPVPGTDIVCWPISASNKGMKMAFTPEYANRIHRRGY